jgi:hypothetical protein
VGPISRQQPERTVLVQRRDDPLLQSQLFRVRRRRKLNREPNHGGLALARAHHPGGDYHRSRRGREVYGIENRLCAKQCQDGVPYRRA